MSRPSRVLLSLIDGPAARRRVFLQRVTGGMVATLAVGLRAQPAADDTETIVVETQQVGGAELELQFVGRFDASLRNVVRAWVQRSARATASYFGRFPVPRVELLLLSEAGGGVRGTTFAEPMLHLRIRLGRQTTRAQLLADWVMVHEMVHLALPDVPDPQTWLHEGVATYVEGIARGRAGLVTPAAVWRHWSVNMAQGQPQAGDTGLDHTRTWGRTYWGGAMFCLLADVQMLQRSGGKSGLREALRGVLAAGGHYGVSWSVARILATADAAVGQDTLQRLYAGMKDSPAPADLEGLWRQLGVEGDRLNDTAPLAAVRRAILS